MLIKDYRTLFVKSLLPFYDEMEAESFFYIVLDEWSGLRRVDLALHPERSFTDAEVEKWNGVLKLLQQQIPIQYILGKTTFYGLSFKVDDNVLIPRPETEELVEWIISENKSRGLNIIDIGTGSGCIAITLAKMLDGATVTGLDVSENALMVAGNNAKANDVSVDFVLDNVLEIDDLAKKFDIIVSNPPYVRNLEKTEIRANVLEYEPHLALFVSDNDPLVFYRKIASLALKNLASGGKLYFEINQYLGKETIEMLYGMGFNDVVLRKDIYGNDRMIRATQ
ncbi:MAG: protein-(glutamine-N5) methyltransferase, release factor-specific [Flavobacterium sp. BFFFF1]|uniref:peptide chain release factor N(5)-glutamine methyltransferase n=1 Tax=Flavobacterium sp. BFFFF1 TaxID=2015557 RepID=UPI000BDB380B|nr:peptide chain release factor N(5)-glutamine methyltransferase [Flavobacterium sp. BFFFF1]OYU81967.1 MAG: protein-(glutamine-N5) methyltransferase, release factor-specific [Flavobacterium sp. BFFFF1]